MKCRYALCLGAAALLAGLSACSRGPDAPAVTIVFWEWWADQQQHYETMARAYEAKTGVAIRFDLSSPEGSVYFNKLQAAAQADTLPDIIGLNGGGELLARYIKADKIHPLTDLLTQDQGKWKNDFWPEAVRPFYYAPCNAYGVAPDTYWGLPITVMNIQIFYHRDLFTQAGLDPDRPPVTWSDWLACADKLKAAGLAPMIIGLGDLWLDYTLFIQYAWPYLGKDNMEKLFAGELPYTHDGCLRAMERLQELGARRLLYPGCISMANKEAEINFANRKAAMMMNGSWGVNVYQELNPNLDLGVFRFPKPPDAEYPMYLIGGVGKACAIARKTRQPEEAVRFLQWFLAEEQQSWLAAEGNQIPANIRAARKVKPGLKPFADGLGDLAPVLGIEELREIQEEISKGVQTLLLGEETPAEVLKRIQVEKARRKRF
ncbi:extracellular solute-binding protein [candidate division FCPU426 bacterium]|nr:extracellular solute-binding protein [candidate division FCPU426 bacterium]